MADVPQLDISEFAIGEKLQEGGWGQVYAARHIPTNRDVAMKFFGTESFGILLLF